jgi:SSS family solute:Na+ symporter
MSLPLAVILAYTAVILGMGLALSRQVRRSGDFFVAGRALGPGLLCATLLAANIGAGSTVGAAGLGYRDGLAAWWWVGSAAFGSFVLAFWVGPRLWRLATREGYHTVGDYLEQRFDRRVRAAVSLLLWAGSLSILSGQLIALAWILDVVVGLPKWLGCLLGGSLTTAYFAAGGLLTSARINVLQLLVKVAGFLLALPLALASVGGLAALNALPPPSPAYWNAWESGGSGWLYLFLLGPAFVISPGLLQKVYGARDESAVRWGVGLNAAGLLVYAGVPVLLGMVSRARFPGLATHELALPALLMDGLPPLVGTIGLAAVFSAEISTADAVLFMLTTSLSQDLYKRFVAPHADDASVLRVSRITALVAGALGTWLAIVSPSVIDALKVFYTLLGVSLFVPLIAGLYVPRARATDALASMAAGVGCVLLVQFGPVSPRVAAFSPVLGLAGAILAFLLSLGARRGAKQR